MAATSSSQAASSSATAGSGAAGTIGETVVGSHMLKIDGFSGTKGLGVGKSINSSAFSVGGHQWYIKCYPCGEDDKSAGWVTLQLCLDHPCPVEAGCVFTMTDGNHTDDFKLFAFSRAHESYGLNFMKREDLKSCLEENDDCFELRCDVKVAKKIPAPAVPWPGLGTEAVAGSHVLTLDGYSNTLGGVGKGETIQSLGFHIGGHRWYIQLYPHGQHEGDKGIIAYLWIDNGHSDNEKVNVRYEITLLTHAREIISSMQNSHTLFGKQNQVCAEFLWNIDYASSPLLQNTFHIRCDVAVVEGITAVPPPNDQHHRRIGDIQGIQRIEEDVTFEVGGHLFTAHKYVLATRSTAFMADFFGPVKENAAADATRVPIADMEPTVFKSLLHFIYTDTLPGEAHEDGNKVVMAQGLLVAADRYAMERLKLICADMLCNCINDASTAATSLNLANKHGCVRLREACIKFFMDQFANNPAP